MQVHGDALLTFCRVRPNEWKTPVLARRSFDLQQFWLWAACFTPEHDYLGKYVQPAFSRLPLTYR